MTTIDYDLISTGMRQGREREWKYLTRGSDGRFFLWTHEPKIGSDGDWCFQTADVLKAEAECAWLPFVPETCTCDMELRGVKAVRIWLIDYNSSRLDYLLNGFSKKEEAEEAEDQMVLFQ